jgi:hypothetical protein
MFLSALAMSVLTLALATSALAYYTAKGSGTFTAVLGTLSVPTISSATAATGGAVALSWASAGGPGEVSYSVTRNGGAPGGTCPSAAEPESEVTSCTDEGLEPGTYVYKVTAKYRSWNAVSATKSTTVTVGPADHFTLSAASSTPSAGAADKLRITAKDKAGGTVTTYSGEKSLTFSGAEAIGTNKPTVANVSGAAVDFGTATAIKFTNGVATVSSTKNGVMKIYKAGPATISVSDGTIESEADPTVTVAPRAKSKLLLSAATTTPVVGTEDVLTTTATDTYGNVATSYAGSHSLKYSDPVASPSGQMPTVTDKSGNDVAIGKATPTVFTEGVATASDGKNGGLVLYKAAPTTLKVAEGSTSSPAITIAAAPGPAASLKLAVASTAPVAGATDNLTTTALDTFGNTATSYTGSREITFSGPEASPSGTAATVSDRSGAAVSVGAATALEFAEGVATVSSTKNGVFKATDAGATTLSATDGTISTASPLSLTVSAGTAANFAWGPPTISAGTLGSPCLFTCTVTTLGNSGTFVAKLAVTDALGNVVSNVGTGRTATVSATGGTISGGTLTIASTGLAESTAAFTYKAPASGSFTNTITATRTGGSTYANATATVSK